MIDSTIVSRRDPNHPTPWCDFEVTDGSLTVIIQELSGLRPCRQLMAEQSNSLLPATTCDQLEGKCSAMATTHNLTLDPSAATVKHVLAVTLDGDLEFIPEHLQQPIYFAHLASYEPSTGEWTKLRFVDPLDG
ncbi:MAG: hypothetical protein WD467_03260 [Candidatus Saccharimonadales bacterium]